MKKYGNKIIAILLTAVCLCGILPLIVSAKTETVYHPPVAAITLNTRYSASAQGYQTIDGNAALTIPLPIDKDLEVVVDFGQQITIQAKAFFLDSNYEYITNFTLSTTTCGTIELLENYTSNATYVVINLAAPGGWWRNLYINDSKVEVTEGAYTLAIPEWYEQIEIPDDTDTEDVDIVNNILTMWQDILIQNVDNLESYYYELTKPIALIIGIPTCIALITLLFCMIGGKKR